MDPEIEKASVAQNVAGEHHKVIGGNTFYGDAHIHIHGDTTIKTEEEKLDSAGPLDPEVGQMLIKLNLMSLKTIFIEEELTMSDLAKITDDQLSKIGVQKIKHRLVIMDEVKSRTCALTGTITLSATGAAATCRPWYLGSYEATGEEEEGAPVYRDSDGRYLYRHSDGTWRADDVIGGPGVIRSVDTAPCPASIRRWQYRDYPDWRSGDITAQCSVHTSSVQ